MASGIDSVAGWSLIGGSLIAFIYFSVWIIILPFVEEEQQIQQYFPDRLYALGSLMTAGVVGLVLIGGFVSLALLRDKVSQKNEKVS